MQISLHTSDWNRLEAFVREHPDPRKRSLAEVLHRDAITAGTSSMIRHRAFGECFERVTHLGREDSERLGRFIGSFCTGVKRNRYPAPKDVSLGDVEWVSVMSPATLEALLALRAEVDDERLAAGVVQAARKDFSAAAFFDYLDLWTRAYRWALAEGRGAAILVG